MQLEETLEKFVEKTNFFSTLTMSTSFEILKHFRNLCQTLIKKDYGEIEKAELEYLLEEFEYSPVGILNQLYKIEFKKQ